MNDMNLPQGPTQRLLALVIDDDIVSRAVLADVLEETGFRVVEAEDGVQGLARYAECQPDLVLLDVTMPGLDGFTVCERLRADPQGAHVPILMLTGLDDEQSIDHAYAAGATDFVSKPCNIPLLRHRLRYVWRAKETADELRRSEAGLALAQQLAKVGSFEIDLATRAFMPSLQARRMIFGAGIDPVLSLDDLALRVVDGDRARVLAALDTALVRGAAVALDFEIRAVDDEILAVHLEMDVHPGERRMTPRAMGTLHDVTAQRDTEKRIRELAFFDGVTGLPNRTYFMEKLGETIAAAARHGRQFAVMFIDLDQFKRVNDTLGHAAGDALLRQVAGRIAFALRRSDTVSRNTDGEEETIARLGGDEFVVLLSEIRRPEDAALVARRILQQLEAPFTISGTEIHVSGSIGISTYPVDGRDEASLLKCADMAMYRVKTDGRNAYRFYTAELNMRVVERLSLEASLRRALEREEFVLHYQPQVTAADGRVVGAEALLRWRHPDLGLLQPADFMAVADETGIMVPLARWILDQACADAARWRNEHALHMLVAVNLSAAQLRSDTFVADIAALVGRHQLGAGQLELEVTENMLAADPERNRGVLQELAALGVHTALDDYGSGQASLSYLRQLPLATLKIDPCFIRELPQSARDVAVIRATLMLAHNLGMRVVAEAVENAAQLLALQKIGCDVVQGYHLSAPLSCTDLVRWVEERGKPGRGEGAVRQTG